MSCEKTLLGVRPSESVLVMLRPVIKLIVVDVVVLVSVGGSFE
jgi:hypothetical protein